MLFLDIDTRPKKKVTATLNINNCGSPPRMARQRKKIVKR
jgi:hypothetical protein